MPDPVTAPAVDPAVAAAAAQAAAVAAQTEALLRADPTQIPAQYNGDVDAAMVGFKGMQGAYTKASQEVATLKAAAVVIPTAPQVVPVAPVAPAVTAPPAPVTTAPAAPVAPGTIQIPTAPEVAPGIDWNKVATDMRLTGAVSVEARAALATQGADEATVAGFERGQQALIAQERSAAIAILGGEEGLANVTTWASKNLNPAQLKTLNEGLAGPHAEMILAGLNQQYLAATRKEGGLVPQKSTSSSAEPGSNLLTFTDQRDVTAHMANPKYQTDPVYRAEVEKAAIALYAIDGASPFKVRRNDR